jgi:hypothetical protein
MARPEREAGPARQAGPFHQFADDDVGVVVALLRTLFKFAGAVEQFGNARHGEGSKEG